MHSGRRSALGCVPALADLHRLRRGNHTRFVKFIHDLYPGFTGDGARRDEGGFNWITGRVDDVLNISDHHLGTTEIESALVTHPQIAEAAVVRRPHPIKGESIYAYVTPSVGVTATEALRAALIGRIQQEIGPADHDTGCDSVRTHAAQTQIGENHAAHPAQDRHRRRRRFGDTSTLAGPAVIEELIANRVT